MSNLGCCFGAYILSGIYLRKNTHLLRFLTKETLTAAQIGATLVGSYTWMKITPLNYIKDNEKTKILEYLDHNLAWDMLKLNNMIPRWLRESVIDWRLVMLYC